MNGLSHTHTNDLLNALLEECIKFYLYIHIVFLLTYLNFFMHLTYSQLCINCMLSFCYRKSGLAGVYIHILFHMHFQHQKQLLINARMN